MLTYILEIIFFISAGIVIYLLMEKLPVIEGMGEHAKEKPKMAALQERIARIADERFVAGMVKILRRTRIVLLKMDNAVVRNLDKMKEKAEEQGKDEKAHILKDVTEEKKNDEKNGQVVS